MQLTKRTDFGLRTLIYLALHPERRVATVEIAKVFGIPQSHLNKVVSDLAAAGTIRTFRGKGGGSTLARPPDDICIGTVVRQLEGEAELINCERPLCPAIPACRLRDLMREAQAACLTVFDGKTLQDVLHGRIQYLQSMLQPAAATDDTSEALHG